MLALHKNPNNIPEDPCIPKVNTNVAKYSSNYKSPNKNAVAPKSEENILCYRYYYNLNNDGTTTDAAWKSGVLIKNLKTGKISDVPATDENTVAREQKLVGTNFYYTEIGLKCPQLDEGEYVYAAYVEDDNTRNLAENCYKFEKTCDRLIYNEDDLLALSGISDGEAIVMADFTVSKPFTVNYTMYGNQHKLTISLPDATISGSGTIKDLTMVIENSGSEDRYLFYTNNEVNLSNCTISKTDANKEISSYADQNYATIEDSRFDLPFCKDNWKTIRNCTFTIEDGLYGIITKSNRGEVGNCKISGIVSQYAVCHTNAGTISGGENNSSGLSAAVCAQNDNKITGFVNRGDATKAGICESNYGTISDCDNHGNIGDKKTGGYRAGICGYNYDSGIIENCSNSGDISGTAYHQNRIYIGGIVGISNGVVKNVSNYGIIRPGVNSWTGHGSMYLYAATIGCGKIESWDNSGKVILPTEDESGAPKPSTLPSTIYTGDVIPL